MDGLFISVIISAMAGSVALSGLKSFALTGFMSSTSSDRFKDVDHLLRPTQPSEECVSEANASDANPSSPEEAAAGRAQKLNAIRKAIDAGAYDSDELLEKAMERLRRTLTDED